MRPQEIECPLFPGGAQDDSAAARVNAPSTLERSATQPRQASADGAQPEAASTSAADTQPAASPDKLSGLQQYARQTLQQYVNGATLSTMRSRHSAAKKAVASVSGGIASGGAPVVSPNMLYMQNLTLIVLLTIESLQQRGLAPARPVLLRTLRAKLGMADAPPPRDRGCAADACADLPCTQVLIAPFCVFAVRTGRRRPHGTAALSAKCQ